MSSIDPHAAIAEALTARLAISVSRVPAARVHGGSINVCHRYGGGARRPLCLHDECDAGNAFMSVQITVRDVPDRVRDELAARAAAQGKSMQEYLRAALERLASRPTVESWLQQVRRRKRAIQTRIDSEEILRNRDDDRR
jgi:plasmid stability protein